MNFCRFTSKIPRNPIGCGFEVNNHFSCPLWGAATSCYNDYYCDKTLKHPNLRIFVYFMEINLRIFNIIRIFALRKYQIVSNFYIKNKEKNI